MMWMFETIMGISLGFEYVPRSEDFGNIVIVDLVIFRITVEWV